MKIRWVIEVKALIEKSKIEEAESMATYFIGSFTHCEEPLYIGPFGSEEEASN